jgi:hypothetical protein
MIHRLIRLLSLLAALYTAVSTFLSVASTAWAQQQAGGHFFVANTLPPDNYLALRTAPSSALGARIGIMSNGTLVNVLEQRSDGWWRVRVYPSGPEGWALSGDGQRQWIVCCKLAAEEQHPAAGSVTFRTPSDNIYCLASSTDGYLRCDLRVVENASLVASKPCEFASGDAFGIAINGAIGESVCHSDTVINDGAPVLQYGQGWRGFGFSCQSEQSGLTCSNEAMHGFSISRSAKWLF